MATYIALLKWTDQGIKDIKQSPARLDAAKQAFASAGGQLKEFYMVMGDYDALVIAEFPSDEVYTATILSIASRGAIHTTTLKAFTEDEYRRIIGSIS